jgi:hypothetical protein
MTEFRLLKGNATEEEIAAVLTVLKNASRIKVVPEPARISKWASPTTLTRSKPAVGYNAWRLSGWARH